MTDPTFASNRLAELPVCFRDAEGEAWAAGMGAAQDNEAALLRTAALSRLPWYCPDDALDLCGTWFGMPRLSGEPDGTRTTGYRGRLCAAWPTREKAGSKGGIISALEAAGFSGVRIFNKHEYDPGAEWWSMFKVRIDGTNSVPSIDLGEWDGGTWDGETWYSETTTHQFLQLVYLIYANKWSYSIPEYLEIVFNGVDLVTFPLVNKWGDADMIWGEFVWGNGPLIP